MLVKTGDNLRRGNDLYSVIIADQDVFVIGKCDRSRVDYLRPEIYSNFKNMNTLNELKFTKIRVE